MAVWSCHIPYIWAGVTMGIVVYRTKSFLSPQFYPVILPGEGGTYFATLFALGLEPEDC